MPIVRVGPDEDFRIVAGQPQLVGWPVRLDDETAWGQVVAVYGDTELGRVVALGIRAEGVIHLVRWTSVMVDAERQTIQLKPQVPWAEAHLDDGLLPPDAGDSGLLPFKRD